MTFKITRFRAFLIHLILSILIFSSLVITMLVFWFPGDLFFIDGGWQGLKLVAMIDLVLGPALTLLLFKPGKKDLVLDMSAIALFQISALIYGFYATYHQQTEAVVFAEGQFVTLSRASHQHANTELTELGEQPQTVTSLVSGNPGLVITPPPDSNTFGQYLTQILNGYPEPHERSDLYVNLEDNYSLIRDARLGTEELKERNQWEPVEAALDKSGIDPSNIDFFNFRARYARGVALLDTRSWTIVDYVEVDPLKPGQSENQHAQTNTTDTAPLAPDAMADSADVSE